MSLWPFLPWLRPARLSALEQRVAGVEREVGRHGQLITELGEDMRRRFRLLNERVGAIEQRLAA